MHRPCVCTCVCMTYYVSLHENSNNSYLTLEGWEPGSCSVLVAQCLKSPNMALSTCVPGQRLFLTQQWNPGNTGFMSLPAASHLCGNREGQQSKGIISLLPQPLLSGLHVKGATHTWGRSFPISQSINQSNQESSSSEAPYSDDCNLWQINIKTKHH